MIKRLTSTFLSYVFDLMGKLMPKLSDKTTIVISIGTLMALAGVMVAAGAEREHVLNRLDLHSELTANNAREIRILREELVKISNDDARERSMIRESLARIEGRLESLNGAPPEPKKKGP